MSLSERLQEAIEASGKSKAEIARACNITQASINHWMTGKTRSLRAETALALEQITGFSAVWLTSGRGPKLAEHTSQEPRQTTEMRSLEKVLQAIPEGKRLVAYQDALQTLIGHLAPSAPTQEPDQVANAATPSAAPQPKQAPSKT